MAPSIVNCDSILMLATFKPDLKITTIQNAIKDPPYNKVLDITFDPIVSSDVVGNSHSGIIDGLATMEINKNKIKVLVWFDNGWGYSARIIDTINKLSEGGLNE